VYIPSILDLPLSSKPHWLLIKTIIPCIIYRCCSTFSLSSSSRPSLYTDLFASWKLHIEGMYTPTKLFRNVVLKVCAKRTQVVRVKHFRVSNYMPKARFN